MVCSKEKKTKCRYDDTIEYTYTLCCVSSEHSDNAAVFGVTENGKNSNILHSLAHRQTDRQTEPRRDISILFSLYISTYINILQWIYMACLVYGIPTNNQQAHAITKILPAIQPFVHTRIYLISFYYTL